MRLPGRKLFYTGVSEDVWVYTIAVPADDAVNCSVSADVRKHSSEKKLYNKNTAVYNEKTDREGENVMQALFDAVNAICGKIQVVSDLFWEFPTNFGWYAAIPILWKFQSGDHFAGRYWNFSDISVPVCTGAEI